MSHLLAVLGIVFAAAQGAEPWRKSDLVRLLTSEALSPAEIAGLIEQNCLSFSPTGRDREDLRALGADSAVMRAIDGCARRADALTVAPAQARVTAEAGTEAAIRVTVRRGAQPEPGMRLLLRGSAAIPGGPARAVEATTDGRGVATFKVPAGTRAATYRLTVAAAGGEALQGRWVVELVTRSGAPAAAEVRPSRLEVRGGEDRSYPLAVGVKDRFGNPVPGQPVELRFAPADRGIAPLSRPTNPQGEAAFTVPAASLRRATGLAVYVSGQGLATVEISAGVALSESRTGFVSGAGQRAVAGTRLSQPLVFEARDTANRPVPGLSVSFRASNARLEPEKGVTDSAGLVQVSVELGERAEPAVVTATVGSLEKQVNLYPRAGPAARLVVTCNGTALEGRFAVAADGPAELRIAAQDAFGNATPLTGLRAAVGDDRVLEVETVAADSAGGTLTLKPGDAGSTNLLIRGSGVRAGLTATVVPKGTPGARACG